MVKAILCVCAVGEPINTEAWEWYHRVVGDGRCPVVDTWWQTGDCQYWVQCFQSSFWVYCTPTLSLQLCKITVWTLSVLCKHVVISKQKVTSRRMSSGFYRRFVVNQSDYSWLWSYKWIAGSLESILTEQLMIQWSYNQLLLLVEKYHKLLSACDTCYTLSHF